MMVCARMAARYPKLTDWIYAHIATVPRKKRVFDAFVQYAEITPDEARRTLATTTRTPVIDIRDLPNSTYGVFIGSHDDERIYISMNVCDRFETHPEDQKDPRMHRLLEATILHELVHWGDWKDGVDQPHEEGNVFEIAAYGYMIWKYW